MSRLPYPLLPQLHLGIGHVLYNFVGAGIIVQYINSEDSED